MAPTGEGVGCRSRVGALDGELEAEERARNCPQRLLRASFPEEFLDRGRARMTRDGVELFLEGREVLCRSACRLAPQRRQLLADRLHLPLRCPDEDPLGFHVPRELELPRELRLRSGYTRILQDDERLRKRSSGRRQAYGVAPGGSPDGRAAVRDGAGQLFGNRVVEVPDEAVRSGGSGGWLGNRHPVRRDLNFIEVRRFRLVVARETA